MTNYADHTTPFSRLNDAFTVLSDTENKASHVSDWLLNKYFREDPDKSNLLLTVQEETFVL